MNNNKKAMIVVHRYKDPNRRVMLDVDDIVYVYSYLDKDSHEVIVIRYILRWAAKDYHNLRDFNDLEVVESFDDVIKKLIECGVNIGGQHEKTDGQHETNYEWD